MNHDRGYYSAYLKKEDTELNKIVKYYLFNDYESLEWLKCNNEFSTLFPSVLAYSYDEILSYDRYARKYHKERNDKNERIDHGILGGVLTYNRLVNTLKRIVLNKESLNIIKAASLTIAQHNIYKSSCVESDKNYPSNLLYKLGSSSNFKITTSLPILYLLSFVDSIECVKVLSKSDNNGKYLETLTVLKNIEVDISERRLVLDFTSLTSNVKAKNFKDLESKYSKHLDSFMSMNKWLDVSVTRDGDCFVFTKD